MERLTVYFTRSHSNIAVNDEDATRETSARTMPQAIKNMQDDDRELLKRFCQSVLECIGGDCKRLTEW